MIWDWSFAFEILPLLARAASSPSRRRSSASCIAAVLGLVLAIAPHAVPAGPRWPISVFVEFIRSTPLLIQIFFIYFVFPKFGIVLDAFTAGVLALGIHYAAYCSEVYRAGLDNVPRGQWEASIALNLSRLDDLPRHHHPAGDPAGRAGARQLSRRPVQGDAAALGHRRARADADRQDPRLARPSATPSRSPWSALFFLVMSLVSAALHPRRSNAT